MLPNRSFYGALGGIYSGRPKVRKWPQAAPWRDIVAIYFFAVQSVWNAPKKLFLLQFDIVYLDFIRFGFFVHSNCVNQVEYRALLGIYQPGPTIEQVPLRFRQDDSILIFSEKLGKCNSVSVTYSFERGDCGDIILSEPGRNCGLGQTGTFSQLIIRPAACIPVFRNFG